MTNTSAPRMGGKGRGGEGEREKDREREGERERERPILEASFGPGVPILALDQILHDSTHVAYECETTDKCMIQTQTFCVRVEI